MRIDDKKALDLFIIYPHNYLHDHYDPKFRVPIEAIKKNTQSCFNLICFDFDAALQVNADTPTEAECQPHIAKAINTLKGDNTGINEMTKKRKEKRRKPMTNVPFDVFIVVLFLALEPDSGEIVIDVDDSKENTSKEEDAADAVVTEDDNSEEAKSDVNDNTDDDDDSQEGIACFSLFFLFCLLTISFHIEIKLFQIDFDTEHERRN